MAVLTTGTVTTVSSLNEKLFPDQRPFSIHESPSSFGGQELKGPFR